MVNICLCGCGKETKNNNKYIHGHNGINNKNKFYEGTGFQKGNKLWKKKDWKKIRKYFASEEHKEKLSKALT